MYMAFLSKIMELSNQRLLPTTCLLPLTSCAFERIASAEASAFHRLNARMKATKGQNTLSSLTASHIRCDIPGDLSEVVNIFVTEHPRKMVLGNVLAY